MMSMWKWVGLGIGLILLGALFESGFAANMMVVREHDSLHHLVCRRSRGLVSRRPGSARTASS